jgi:hypothetical protein
MYECSVFLVVPEGQTPTPYLHSPYQIPMHHWKGHVKDFFYIAKSRATENKEGKMR